VGRNQVVSILITVVLPAPLGPTSPNSSPLETESVTASAAIQMIETPCDRFGSKNL
jgi:hypothetical protein